MLLVHNVQVVYQLLWEQPLLKAEYVLIAIVVQLKVIVQQQFLALLLLSHVHLNQLAYQDFTLMDHLVFHAYRLQMISQHLKTVVVLDIYLHLQQLDHLQLMIDVLHNKMQLENNRYWHQMPVLILVILVIIITLQIKYVILVLLIVMFVLMLQHAKHVL